MSERGVRKTVGSPSDYEPTYGNPKRSTSNDVAFEKEPRHGAKHGAGEQQPDGLSRALPKAEAVKTAEVVNGKALECVKMQVGENRHAINPHEKEEGHHGPNN
jgi:hypothetical protein